MKLKVIVNRNRLLFKVIGPRSGVHIDKRVAIGTRSANQNPEIP